MSWVPWKRQSGLVKACAESWCAALYGPSGPAFRRLVFLLSVFQQLAIRQPDDSLWKPFPEPPWVSQPPKLPRLQGHWLPISSWQLPPVQPAASLFRQRQKRVEPELPELSWPVLPAVYLPHPGLHVCGEQPLRPFALFLQRWRLSVTGLPPSAFSALMFFQPPYYSQNRPWIYGPCGFCPGLPYPECWWDRRPLCRTVRQGAEFQLPLYRVLLPSRGYALSSVIFTLIPLCAHTRRSIDSIFPPLPMHQNRQRQHAPAQASRPAKLPQALWPAV